MKARRKFLFTGVILVLTGISLWVNLPPWLIRRRAAAHLRAGETYARKGNMESALSEWRIASRSDPDFPEPYRKIGSYLLNKADRPDLASRIYGQLAAIDPGGPHIYCNLAKSFALLNEQGEARQNAKLAVQAEPNCGLAHNILGVMLLSEHQMKPGLAELERACKLEPRDSYFRIILAQAYIDVSDLEGAERSLQTVLQQDANNAKAHYLLGWTYAHGKRAPDRIAAALKQFEEAARLQPDDAEIYSEWGRLLVETGRAREARDVLSKAWLLNPRLVQVAHNLAVAYRSSGDRRNAAAMEAASSRLVQRAERLRMLMKRADIDPGNVEITLQLAEAELEDGNLTDSLRYVQGVLRQRQDDRRALKLLVRIYAIAGKPEMAEAVQDHLRKLPKTPQS